MEPWMIPLWRGSTNDKRTGIEKKTESFLIRNKLNYTFQRQVGPFIVDFWLDDYKVAIEVDGRYWHSLPSRKARDERQARWCAENDVALVRLKEYEVKKGDFSKLSLLVYLVKKGLM